MKKYAAVIIRNYLKASLSCLDWEERKLSTQFGIHVNIDL